MTECSSDGCRFNENCVASGSTGFCEAIQFNTGIKDAEGLEFGGISFITEDNLDCLKEQGLIFFKYARFSYRLLSMRTMHFQSKTTDRFDKGPSTLDH